MSLRKTTLIVISLTFIGLVAVLTLTFYQTLARHFLEDERKSMLRNLERLERAIGSDFDYLEKTAKDWAKWDDTYAFIEDENPAYVEANLSDATLRDLQIHIMVFIHSSGRVVFAKAFDLQNDQAVPVPSALLDRLNDRSRLLTFSDPFQPVRGVLALPMGPLLVVSHPVLPTEGGGQPRGMFLIGHYLDPSALQDLSTITSLSIAMHPFADSALEPDFQQARQAFDAGETRYVASLSENAIAGYWVLADIDGQPAYILRVDEDRLTYQRGRTLLEYLITANTMTGITFGVMVLLFLELLVFSRLNRLRKDVQALGASGDISTRLTVTHKDELSSLGAKINEMLGDLEQAQHRRFESEERFRTLVEAMDDLVFTVGTDCTQVTPFGQWPEHVSFSPDVFLGDGPDSLNHREAISRSLAGEHLVYNWTGNCTDGLHHFQTSLSPLRDTQGKITGVAGVGRDISADKQLQSTLQQRVDELALLFDVSQSLLGQIDTSQTIQAVFEQAAGRLGLEKGWVGWVSGEDPAIQPLAVFRMPALAVPTLQREAGAAWHALKTGTDVILHLSPGETGMDLLPLSASPESGNAPGCPSLAAVPLAHGDEVTGVLVAYSPLLNDFCGDRLQLLHSLANLMEMALHNAWLFQQVRSGRERMQALSRQLVEIQEAERRHLALELHDEIGQVLTSLKILLDLEDRLGAGVKSPRLMEAQRLMNDLIGRVRNLSMDLHPGMLDDLGLLPALVWLFERHLGQSEVQVTFTHQGLEGERLPTKVEITAYRIIQEALTNAARHAGVKEVQVRLWRADKTLGIQVEDRGAGFDTRDLAHSGTTRGLASLRERTNLMGGELIVESAPGKGTRLTAELPINGILERRRKDARFTPSG